MEIVTRAIIFYLYAVLLLRLLGKGLTFQQKPFDFMVFMLIGSASAALIVNRDVPILNGLAAMTVLAVLHTIISIGALSNPFKAVLGGSPDILIRNGRIVKENLIKNQVNVEQLIAGLRTKGYRRIHDVELAVLEAGGQLSVIPKSQLRPVNPADLQLNTGYEGISTPVVIDGKVIKENLYSLGLDEDWLAAELSQRKINGAKKVLLASIDTDGSLYVAEQPPINYLKAFFMGEGKDTEQGKNPDILS